MIKRLKENEKGLTLIELLVVIVILGIIAAIAIIAIGGIIDNSKKDAHIANAKQLANATKLYMAANDMSTTDANGVTLEKLIEEGYTDEIKDPSDKEGKYSITETKIDVERKTGKDKEGNDTTKAGFKYYVTLKNSDGGKTYIDKKEVSGLKRTDVEVDGK